MNKNTPQSLKVIGLALVLSVGISYVAAWTAPTQTPPNGNVSAPINVSVNAQTKAGNLQADQLFAYSFKDASDNTYFVKPNGDSKVKKVLATEDVCIFGTSTCLSTVSGSQGPQGIQGLTGSQGPAGVSVGVKAWVNFDINCNIIASGRRWCPINSGYNISGVEEVSTNTRYIIHFSTPMPDSNYFLVGGQDYVATYACNGVASLALSPYNASPLPRDRVDVVFSGGGASVSCPGFSGKAVFFD